MDDPGVDSIIATSFQNLYEYVDKLKEDSDSKYEELEQILAALLMAFFGLAGLVNSMLKVMEKDPESAEFLDYDMNETMKQILEMVESAGATGVEQDPSPTSESVEDLAEEV